MHHDVTKTHALWLLRVAVLSGSHFCLQLLDFLEIFFQKFKSARRQINQIEKMKLFGYLFGVSMAMVHLNYTDNLPDGGLLLDIIQEQV